MSRLTDLIAEAKAKDPQIGADLEREFRALSSRLPFGLNFERHRPEAVELPQRPVRKGDKVRVLLPRGSMEQGDRQLWQVLAIHSQGARRTVDLRMLNNQTPELRTVSTDDVVVVAEFKDPIFPGLISTGKIERGGAKPYHAVINGENYHALNALSWSHRGKIDAIYIDPPYNTGARDWKYNNDYVESDDLYRHSKWLAFIERRLLVAKELLRPDDSVLIVTIDEKEYLRLGLLLEQLFPEAAIQMVTSVVNPFGVSRQRELSRVDEYVFFVRMGHATLGAPNSSRALLARDETSSEETANEETFWFSFMRAGSNSGRSHSPGCHYPIFVTKAGEFHSVGSPLPRGKRRDGIRAPRGTVACWPIKTNGEEGVWQGSPEVARNLFANGYAKIGDFRGNLGRHSITYLREGTIARIAAGQVVLNDDGTLSALQEATTSGRTVWAFSSHNATSHGSKLLAKMLPTRRFPYPKSLYAVEDSLRVAVGKKPNAVVLDFFAGSGTTAHAVLRLNRQDGGQRQCISITNNEVAADEQLELRQRELRPGDAGWEQRGICDFITKPRIAAAITGKTPEGNPIVGTYRFSDEFPISDGFQENAEFFTLSYETPVTVAHSLAFSRIAPLLWLRAGSSGDRIEVVPSVGWAVVERYGLLTEPDQATPFLRALRKREGLQTAFIVTDDDRRFQSVARRLPEGVEAVQLYESYLTNFAFANGGEE